MKKKIVINKDFNIAGVNLLANSVILEFISLSEINVVNPVNITEVQEYLYKEATFKFHLSEKEIVMLANHYDKYHEDNIALSLLKDIKIFNFEECGTKYPKLVYL